MSEQEPEQAIGRLIIQAVEKAVASIAHEQAPRQPADMKTEADRSPSESSEFPDDESQNATATGNDATANASSAHYYLDEAGDPNIFAHKGRVIIGQEGCSRFFTSGLLEVKDPARLTREMSDLRAELLADPYFRGVPSFTKEQRKTALFFHAKDDLPEVRRDVFRLLLRHDVSFAAIVTDKAATLNHYVRPQQQVDPTYRYNPNEQYDYLVKCLSKGRLHKKSVYNVHFADRGASDRTEALRAALESKQQEMNKEWNITEASVLNVSVHQPQDMAGLQAADYFLWALQRLYEKGEDRFWNLLQPKCSTVNERTRRQSGHGGMFYTRKRPLTLAALKQAREMELTET